MAFSLTGGQGWSMGIDNSLSDSFMIHNSSGGVDSSSQFTINTSGNVGIGTVSPTSTTLLHISTPQSGAAAGTGLTISGWNGSAESRVQLMSYGIGGGTFALRTGTSNTERLRIDSNGKVGINSSSPPKP